MANVYYDPDALFHCQEIINVRWAKVDNKIAITTQRASAKGRGRVWRSFGDPLPTFHDGFEVHDVTHFLFAERLGWSPVLRRYFFHTDPDPLGPSRPILTEEAIALNEALKSKENQGRAASLTWCLDIARTVRIPDAPRSDKPCTRAKMKMVLQIAAQEQARLLRDIARDGIAQAVFEITCL